MKRAILVCGCAALALGACSKKADTAATTGESAPTAAAAPALATPPTRKAGLWEQSMTLVESSGSTKPFMQGTKMCVDEASEAKMKWWATENRGGKSDCTEQSITPRLGGGWTIHSVCTVGEMKVVSDGQVTGDFGSHYKFDATSVTSGSSMPQSNGTHKMSMEATWKGPCPADMKGGDIEMPGGMKINMVDAANKAPTAEGFKPGQRPTAAQMAQMRAQAMEMAKRMKAAEGK